jgi:MPBQ/MSBQ methyltransferase
MDNEPFILRYDRMIFHPPMRRYYAPGDHYNVGLWLPGITSQHDASEALVRRLVHLLDGTRPCRVLDVACGLGASSAELLAHHPSAVVTGINLSLEQLRRCRGNAPGCTFLAMDATALAFADETFDAILCIEAAFHFETRADFLREAHRVLKPGGRLVLSDMLFRTTRWVGEWMVPEDNLVGLDAYRAAYAAAGFAPVTITDVTGSSWIEFCRRFSVWNQQQLAAEQANECGLARFRETMIALRDESVDHYLIVTADRPAALPAVVRDGRR